MTINSLPVFRSLDAAFLDPLLAVGAELHHDEHHAADQLVELVQSGVTRMLDLRREWSDEAWVRRVWPQMHYLHLGVDDAGQRMADDWFDTGVEWVVGGLNSGRGVYVHCHQGSNRAPSMALAVLLTLGHDVVDAVDLIRTVRPHARIAYAADALDWHHGRHQVDGSRRSSDLRRLDAWRRTDPRDPSAVLRAVRHG